MTVKVIEKKSRIPIYVQIIDDIVNQIELGLLVKDERISSERELCESYGVSRSSVRKAIQELEKDNYVYVQHGTGTFVAPKQYKQKLLSFYSFTEEIEKIGKEPWSKVISFEKVLCDERTAHKMKIDIGDSIYRFTRLRYADDEALMVVTTHIPCKRFPGFNEEMLNGKASLYQAFMEYYGVVFSKAKESLKAIGAPNKEAKILNVTPDFPCMHVERVTFEKDMIIEYAFGVTRGDMFQYDIELQN